jgi:transcriptional regulator with XRE-family HTH domain
MFYQKYAELCELRNEKPYSVAKKLGLGNSNVAQWKKGSTPRGEVLSKISDYFGVSVAYLLGEEQQKPTGQVADGLSAKDMALCKIDEIAASGDDQALWEIFERLSKNMQKK